MIAFDCAAAMAPRWGEHGDVQVTVLQSQRLNRCHVDVSDETFICTSGDLARRDWAITQSSGNAIGNTPNRPSWKLARRARCAACQVRRSPANHPVRLAHDAGLVYTASQ
jgi:hypothetical protein